MTRAFADTSFFMALVNKADEHHEAAFAIAGLTRYSVVTRDYVLLEFGNACANRKRRHAFARVLDALDQSPGFLRVRATDSILDEAVRRFRRRSGTDWSLVDCTSFVIMEKLRLTDAITNDAHFTQAGFRALLTSP